MKQLAKITQEQLEEVKSRRMQSLDLGNENAPIEKTFDSIPDEIFEFTWLRHLDLSGNDISEIPEKIEKLTNLSSLILRKNNLNSLPEEIANLDQLSILDLSYNKFSNIPSWIGKLSNLRTLILRGNKIKIIPSEIANLEKLEYLILDENPLEAPPPEVAARGLNSIINYFRQIQNQGLDNLFEAKLLIVGEGGAGKTTLSKKIQNPAYELQEEDTTKGIDVLSWDFSTPSNHNFRVNVWDFGGQEIYHATHQFFLTKRSLYLLVADTRRDDTDFYYWLNIIELLSDNSPIIIVKNEKQDRHREINELQLKGQFENLKEIISTNLATNRGLEALIKSIKHYMTQLPHVGAVLPQSWVNVREALVKSSKNYMTIDNYLDICQKNGFDSYKDKMQLSGYLHDLGVFLHFQDDPILSKTIILKPKWATDAAYKVLDNASVINNYGRFNKKTLGEIWGAKEYVGMHNELLQLMMKFRLCYQIPGTRDTYIAPQLLSENQPSYKKRPESSILIKYTYEFMPKGILTQFIVVMHKFIFEQKFVWKSGVLLDINGSKAEIIEHYGKREIQVRITGKNRKDAMAIVMYEIDKIHSTYSRLKYSKHIPCNCDSCKNLDNPHFYQYDVLLRFYNSNQEFIQCQESFTMVDVSKLLSDNETRSLPKPPKENMLSGKKVEINIGDNSKVGNIVFDSKIEDSFKLITESDVDTELKDLLLQLYDAVEIMTVSLIEEESKQDVTRDLNTLIEEAVKISPRRKWYELSAEGLIKAAETVGKIGKPVIELSSKIVAMLLATKSI